MGSRCSSSCGSAGRPSARRGACTAACSYGPRLAPRARARPAPRARRSPPIAHLPTARAQFSQGVERAEVRGGLGVEDGARLLLRRLRRQQLLGEQDDQAPHVDRRLGRVAPHLADHRHGVDRLQVPALLGVRQVDRRQGRRDALRRQPEVWHAPLRGRVARLGHRRLLRPWRRLPPSACTTRPSRSSTWRRRRAAPATAR